MNLKHCFIIKILSFCRVYYVEKKLTVTSTPRIFIYQFNVLHLSFFTPSFVFDNWVQKQLLKDQHFLLLLYGTVPTILIQYFKQVPPVRFGSTVT